MPDSRSTAQTWPTYATFTPIRKAPTANDAQGDRQRDPAEQSEAGSRSGRARVVAQDDEHSSEREDHREKDDGDCHKVGEHRQKVQADDASDVSPAQDASSVTVGNRSWVASLAQVIISPSKYSDTMPATTMATKKPPNRMRRARPRPSDAARCGARKARLGSSSDEGQDDRHHDRDEHHELLQRRERRGRPRSAAGTPRTWR
jgi:hypothetical protein